MSGRNGEPEPARSPGKEAARRPLPRRFYKTAGVEEVGTTTQGERQPPSFRVVLDGQVARTPKERPLEVPTRALAEALAEEWNAQGDHIDPEKMPLTRLVNTALDGISEQMDEVVAAIAEFAGSDLLCYRAETPDTLISRQATAWDPILAWAEAALGARWNVGAGVMPVAQPPETLARVEAAVRPFDALALAALHVITALTGSALLALALASRQISVDEAWAAAHVDEDWQVEQWGQDWEAADRRSRRWADMQAASHLLELLRLP